MKSLVLLLLVCAFAGASNDCPHGDSPYYIVNGMTCDQLSRQRLLCYNTKVRRECCATCARLKISATKNCEWGDQVTGCTGLSARECRIPSYNAACCRTCQGSAAYCRNHEYITFNGYRCHEYILRGAHSCYNPRVLNNCCESCRARQASTTIPGCIYGDRKSRIFTDRQTGRRYRCENLRGSLLHKCEDSRVLEDCCATCSSYRRNIYGNSSRRVHSSSSGSESSGGRYVSSSGSTGSSSGGTGGVSSETVHVVTLQESKGGQAASTNGNTGCRDRNSRIFTDSQTGTRYQCSNLRSRNLLYKCEDARVLQDCCNTCSSYRRVSNTSPACTDRRSRFFTDSQSGVRYHCDSMRNRNLLYKCEDARVREDCCATCSSYRRSSSSSSGGGGSSSGGGGGSSSSSRTVYSSSSSSSSRRVYSGSKK